MSDIIPLGAYWRDEALGAFQNRTAGRAARAYARGCIRKARVIRSPQELKPGDVLANDERVVSVQPDGPWRTNAVVERDGMQYPARFRNDEAVRLASPKKLSKKV